MTARLHFEGSAKGALEQVEVEMTTVVVAGGQRLPPEHLTQAETLAPGAPTHAQPVLIGAANRLWLAVGAASTTALLVGRSAWRFEEIEPQWNRLILRSIMDHETRHEGTLAAFAEPRVLIEHWTGNKRLPAGAAVFCSAPNAGGPSPANRTVTIEIEDPVLQRKLTHSYSVQSPPIVS